MFLAHKQLTFFAVALAVGLLAQANSAEAQGRNRNNRNQNNQNQNNQNLRSLQGIQPGIANQPALTNQPGQQNEPQLQIQSQPGVQNAPRLQSQPGIQNPSNIGFRPQFNGQQFASPSFNGQFNGQDFLQQNQAFSINQPPRPQPQVQSFSGKPIIVRCDARMAEGVNVLLTNGLKSRVYKIGPGQELEFRETSAWRVEFDRGASFGTASYRLVGGIYTFRGSDRGWELFKKRA